MASIPCEYKIFTEDKIEAQGREITCPYSYSEEKEAEIEMKGWASETTLDPHPTLTFFPVREWALEVGRG